MGGGEGGAIGRAGRVRVNKIGRAESFRRAFWNHGLISEQTKAPDDDFQQTPWRMSVLSDTNSTRVNDISLKRHINIGVFGLNAG